MATTTDLTQRIDAALATLEQKHKRFQLEETQKHQEYQARLALLGKTFDSLGDIWKPRLDVLARKFGDKVAVKPTITPSTRDALFAVESDLARIRLRFRATSDSDIRKLILIYDLEIVPILMKFDAHAELEVPLDRIDREAIGRWMDERIMSFVSTYVALHENQYYLGEQMVRDPISGTQFPKLAAGATLERAGHTYYFVSEETRREFEQKGAIAVE
jgi:YHS domain-containing protein